MLERIRDYLRIRKLRKIARKRAQCREDGFNIGYELALSGIDPEEGVRLCHTKLPSDSKCRSHFLTGYSNGWEYGTRKLRLGWND